MKKSGKILIVILCLIIVGLAGFIVWDKVINKDENIESNTSSNQSEKVNYQITHDIINGRDADHYMEIVALDSNKQEVWKYTTDTRKVGQYDNIVYLGDSHSELSGNGLVYLFVYPEVIALDYETGNKVWDSGEITNGIFYPCESAIGKDETLYLCNGTSFDVCIIDKEGTLIKWINGFDYGILGANDGFWIDDFSLDENKNELVVYYGDFSESDEGLRYKAVINLSDYSVEKTKIDTNTTTSNSKEFEAGYSEGYVKCYIEKIKALDYVDDSTKYGLLYVNQINIPYLIVDTGGDLSIYKINNNTVVALKERDSYGTHGRDGYDYIEGTNIMRDYCTFEEGYAYEIYNELFDYKYCVECTFSGEYRYSDDYGEERIITEEEFNKLSYENSKFKHLRDIANKNKEEIIKFLENQ